MSLSKVYQSNFSVSYALCSILFSTIYLLTILELQHFLRNKLATKVVIELFFSFFLWAVTPVRFFRAKNVEVPARSRACLVDLDSSSSRDEEFCCTYTNQLISNSAWIMWKVKKVSEKHFDKISIHFIFLRLVLSFYYLWFWLTLDQF